MKLINLIKNITHLLNRGKESSDFSFNDNIHMIENKKIECNIIFIPLNKSTVSVRVLTKCHSKTIEINLKNRKKEENMQFVSNIVILIKNSYIEMYKEIAENYYVQSKQIENILSEIL